MGSLENLRTLCLKGYKLGNISILESLQALEILDLFDCCFEELPNGIIALKKLKLLDLQRCKNEKNNACEVIGGCLQLEELYLSLDNPFVEEFWPHNFSSRLQRYFISTTTYSSRWNLPWPSHTPSRALCMRSFDVPAKMNDLFLRTEFLYLKNLVGGYKNIIPSMDPNGMNQLTDLKLDDCGEIECLFDNVDMLEIELVFSSLLTIQLDYLYNLRQVFRGSYSRCFLKELQEMHITGCQQLYNISFPRNSKLCNLKKMTIRYCRKLTSLFTPSVFQTLQLLELLQIEGCSKLKHIFEEVSSQSHTSLPLSKLRTLDIGRCHELEYVFPICLAPVLESLQRLCISDSRKLKYVFGGEKEHNISVQANIKNINWPNLDDLRLLSLPNLIAICPEDSRPYLPKLTFLMLDCPRLPNFYLQKTVIGLDLQDTKTMEKEIPWLVAAKLDHLCDQMVCPELEFLDLSELGVEGLFQFQMGELGSNKKLLVPLNLSLTYVYLRYLPHLKLLWKGPTNFLNLQLLQYFTVNDCPKLKTIFSPTVVRSLPMLRWLKIYNCEELEQIFDSGDVQELKSLYTCSQQKCFPKLEIIIVQKCNKLKFLFYNFVVGHFPGLKKLKVQECSQLEKIFAFECEIDDKEGTDMDEGQVPLGNLKNIKLSSLPNFEEIHHQFKLKDHVEQTIEDCPKYSQSLYL